MKQYKRHFLLVPICALLVFIWGNSMASADTSSAISSGFLSRLLAAFPSFLSWVTEDMVRKFAHFSEFGLLGFLLAWYILLLEQRGFHRFTLPLFLSMLAANIDETIQVFAVDRGPSVIDVWIDTAGACCGMVLLFLLFALFRKIRKGDKQ